jgi:hypothetical protein
MLSPDWAKAVTDSARQHATISLQSIFFMGSPECWLELRVTACARNRILGQEQSYRAKNAARGVMTVQMQQFPKVRLARRHPFDRPALLFLT